MKFLLDERYAPITSTIGFLEMEYTATVAAFETWHWEVYRPGGSFDQMEDRDRKERALPPLVRPERAYRPMAKREVAGPLANALAALPPFNGWRQLLVPTSSRWTAYFDNNRRGTDPVSFCAYLSKRHGCRGLQVTAKPDSLGIKSTYDTHKRGRYGACVLELWGPEGTPPLYSIRGIYAVNDGGRWKFETSGNPLPFEEPETYKARRVKDRFPFELLDRYCRALGLRPFNEDFYLPPEQPTATLFDTPWGQGPSYTLAEVQEDLGIAPPAQASSGGGIR